jgi:hypothetical protein
MGLLVKVENGDKQFWEQNFHAANGKPQHALKVPCYFLLSFGAAGVKMRIFSFFICSQHVPNVFPMGVPNSTLL